MAAQQCGACRYFVGVHGRVSCHRNALVVALQGLRYGPALQLGFTPNPENWCGEWEARVVSPDYSGVGPL